MLLPQPTEDITTHMEAVPPHDVFTVVTYDGATWDLSHLRPFVMHEDVGDLWITIVVSFSCHCFTEDLSAAPGDTNRVYFWDGREQRVLNARRYAMSRQFLPALVHALPERQIRITGKGNFFTFEAHDDLGQPVNYAVFFEVEKDKSRRKRLRLRVQSAYPIKDGLTRRQREAGKVRFKTLVRAIYNDKAIKP